MERLGQVKKNTGKGGNKWLIILSAVGILILVLGGLKQYGINLAGFFTSNNSNEKLDQADSDLKAYQEFAVHVVVGINNIGFHNAQSHISDMAQYFSQDLLSSFQENYFDSDYLKMIADRKLFVSSQEVQAIDTKVIGDEVGVWVTGKNVYSSALTGTMKTVPFSIRLVMTKINGQIKVVKFRMMQKYL